MRLRYFTVKGSGNFPFEMLCSNQCYPANIVEADKIRMSCPTVADERSIVFACDAMEPVRVAAWAAVKWPVVQK